MGWKGGGGGVGVGVGMGEWSAEDMTGEVAVEKDTNGTGKVVVGRRRRQNIRTQRLVSIILHN